jgi:membrane-bound metal-dependent hydrolase YbcI (DUF457 family)
MAVRSSELGNTVQRARVSHSVPITPLHFGPGTLLKSAFPSKMSLSAFVLSQIAIDLESAYHLFAGDWPVHREAHSLPLATLVGLASGTAVWLAGTQVRAPTPRVPRAEFDALPAHVGGLLGGLTHPILDGIMHTDLRPFWPISLENPFFEVIDLAALHLLCLASGLVGLLVLAVRSTLGPRPG